MADDNVDSLHRVIQLKIQAGLLPNEYAVAVKCGSLERRAGAVCDSDAELGCTQYDVTMADRRILRFHMICLDLWE